MDINALLKENITRCNILLNSDLPISEKISGLHDMFTDEHTRRLAAGGTDFNTDNMQTEQAEREQLFASVAEWLLSLEEVADEQMEQYCDLGEFCSAVAEDGEKWLTFRNLRIQYLLENNREDEAAAIIAELDELTGEKLEEITPPGEERRLNNAGHKYKSCTMTNNFFMNFSSRLDTGSRAVTLCSESVSLKPGVTFDGTPAEILDRFISFRERLIASSRECKRDEYTEGCINCANYQLGEWKNDGLIHYINLSMYPSPCQCRCCYCGLRATGSFRFSKEEHAGYYEKLFEVIELARRKGLIANNANYQVSCGEITIHPYFERIFSLVKNQRAIFFTNAFIYNDKIAQNLKTNPRSAINLSIDAGTPNTWQKVKGVDNFDTVKANLLKYRQSCARDGQITLKYIVLPGVNDNRTDYQNVIDLMKSLGTKHLTIARDTRKKYSDDDDERGKTTNAAGLLAAMLHKNGLTFDMFTLTPQERADALKVGNRLLNFFGV